MRSFGLPCRLMSHSSAASSSAGRLHVLTYNLLSPGYFRKAVPKSKGVKRVEASHAPVWSSRLAQALSVISELSCDVCALQEVWFKKEYLQQLDSALGREYAFVGAQRSGKKEDGVALLVRRASWSVLAQKSVQFGDEGDRALALALLSPTRGGQPLLFASLHLTFPHTAHDEPVRLGQAEAALSEIASFAAAHGASGAACVLGGDLNGTTADPAVCTLLLRGGFASAYAAVWGAEAAVTHVDHDGHAAGVDYVLFRQPRSGVGGSGEGQGALSPLLAALLPADVPDATLMMRPVVQTKEDVAAAAGALTASGGRGLGAASSNAGVGVGVGVDGAREPLPADAEEGGGGSAGCFAGGARPMAALSWSDWCQLSDHRVVCVTFGVS